LRLGEVLYFGLSAQVSVSWRAELNIDDLLPRAR
jgi:hypothetical protein